jgi:hypothetical protein
MMTEELPHKEILKRTVNTFKCEDCEKLIGAQKDNAGENKPDSVTEYYRVKLLEPMRFIFVCPNCSCKY